VHPVRHLPGLLHRRAADDHTRDTVREQVIDGGAVAQPAADLQFNRALRGKLLDQAAIVQHAVTSAIEIDDVQPACAEPLVTQ